MSGLWTKFRLRVVSNFGDGDCGAGKIHTRAREISSRRDAKGAPKIDEVPLKWLPERRTFNTQLYIPVVFFYKLYKWF